MKKIFYSGLLFSLLFLGSCANDDLVSLNNDKKSAINVPGVASFTASQIQLFNQIVSPDPNDACGRFWAQQWTQTTYTDESNYIVSARDLGGDIFEDMYTNVLQNLKKAREGVMADISVTDAVKNNQLALILLNEAFTYHVLVDYFGNVPYTEALDITNVTPKYDDGRFIYTEVIAKIDKALGMLNTAEGSFGSGDLVYNGDVTKWKKFANSLKLRIALRLADTEAALAKTLASQAVNSGVFGSNSDNAQLSYDAAPPHTNPIFKQFVTDNRPGDYVIAAPIVDLMNTLEDPRRAKFFADNKDDATTTDKIEYIGGVPGANNNYDTYTHVPKSISDAPTLPGVILDYTEVAFLLAEAAERSLVGTPADAAMHYDKAITSSFEFWGLTSADATAYLAKPEVAYTTATGDYREKIGTQKWLALYNRGFEAWTEYRRLDAPVLPKSDRTKLDVPTRMEYPNQEVLINEANYIEASSAIGGDKIDTKLFWDVK